MTIDEASINEMIALRDKLDVVINNYLKSKTDKPYITFTVRKNRRKYNPSYGADRVCKCGHPYHRHFDSYENMSDVGCKYCSCMNFKEKTDKKSG